MQMSLGDSNSRVPKLLRHRGLNARDAVLTSFGDERVRAWGEYARFIVFLDDSDRYCHVSR